MRTPWSSVHCCCLFSVVNNINSNVTSATPCIYLMLFSRELNKSFPHLQKEEKDQGDEKSEPSGPHFEYKHPLF